MIVMLRLRNQLMQLREFQPGDLEILVRIDSECFPAGISYSFEELASFVADRRSRTWVAVEQERTVGFLIAQQTSRQSAHIVTIDVIEDARRHGIGSVLMDTAEAWAASLGASNVALETAETNLVAQRFYERRKYLKVKKIARYYADGSAAWLMVKRLD